MLRNYVVIMSVRQIGAIGLFYPLQDTVEATNIRDALFVFRDKYQHKYETGTPLLVRRVDNTCDACGKEYGNFLSDFGSRGFCCPACWNTVK